MEKNGIPAKFLGRRPESEESADFDYSYPEGQINI